MGLPDIIIEFSKKAVTAIQNGSTGIVGIMLKDAKNKGAMVLRSVDEIPTGDSAFSAENTAYIELCLSTCLRFTAINSSNSLLSLCNSSLLLPKITISAC